MMSKKKAKPKEQQPPPINVTGITEYARLKLLLEAVMDKEYKVTALNNNVWKINTPDSETYRALVTKLNTDKIQWFTYENKNERPIRVMVRGLHSTCPKEDVIEDLRFKGFKILDAVNILRKEKKDNGQGEQITIKRGLPLFMLTFDNKENIANIYNIKSILNIVVKVEPMRKNSTLIPQCKRCQGFNHTQGYCQKEPRCVKCAGKHLTKACTRSRNTSPVCVNFSGHHPANYRGCEVTKELQRRRNEAFKYQKRHLPGEPQDRKSFPEPSKGKTPGKSTAQNTGMKTYSQALRKDENEELTVEKTLELILERLNEQKYTNKMIFDRINKLESSLKKKR